MKKITNNKKLIIIILICIGLFVIRYKTEIFYGYSEEKIIKDGFFMEYPRENYYIFSYDSKDRFEREFLETNDIKRRFDYSINQFTNIRIEELDKVIFNKGGFEKPIMDFIRGLENRVDRDLRIYVKYTQNSKNYDELSFMDIDLIVYDLKELKIHIISYDKL